MSAAENELIAILQAKIKRLESALADRNQKIEGMERVLAQYRRDRREKKPQTELEVRPED